jgi:formylglycine-generating enzyme required for sulfatase activity
MTDYTDLTIRLIVMDTATGRYRVEGRRADGAFVDGGVITLDEATLLPLVLEPERYGRQLSADLLVEPLAGFFAQSLGVAQGQSNGRLRVRLWIDEDAAVAHGLSWERLWVERNGQATPLATAIQTPFSRYFGINAADPTPVSERPLRMLVALANPDGLPASLAPVRVEEEVSALWQTIGELQGLQQVQITLLPGRTGLSPALQATLTEAGCQVAPGPTSLDNLMRLLPGCHLWHFVGHGSFQREPNRGAGKTTLHLEDENGRWSHIDDTLLLTKLAGLEPKPHLLFLVACESAKADGQYTLTGLGPQLVRAGVPAVVAMRENVPMSVARQLTGDFYRHLLEHGVVDVALNQARNLLLSLQNVDWAIPILYMRLHDGRLFTPLRSELRRDLPGKPFEPETVLVPGGAFLMGSDDQPDEAPAHRLTLSTYRIGKFPVTNCEYAEFIKRVRTQEEPKRVGWFIRQPPAAKLDHPVVGISWHDARAYCAWLSQESGRTYRLPSEAEWEKAARGPQGLYYPWGNQWGEGYANVASADTTPVDAHPQGASPYGCQAMLGNVQEWTNTLWGRDEQNNGYGYPYDPTDGREDPEAAQYLGRAARIHRGGSYRSPPAEVRASARAGSSQDARVSWRGFRVVMEIYTAHGHKL